MTDGVGSQVRVAADIGGTFTDVVLDSPVGRRTAKVLTTPRAPEAGVFEALGMVLEQVAVAPADVAVFVHGTTLATNALIERNGARTAFLTTRGFRDILEMGFEKRFEQYDVFMDKPEPLVPRPLRREVTERVSARGRVLVPLDEAQVRAIAAEWKAAGIEAVAVGLLHSYAHPAHEQAVREVLSAEMPAATVCLSSEVCPEIREFERFSTTCANAYVRPLISGYLHRLQEGLVELGMTCPFYLMMSGGGVTTVENAARFPIRLVESGPAGGAILAGHVARECGLTEALSIDMGGTTAKICLIEDGTPERSRTFEVARRYRDLKGSGLPVRVPVIEMVEIGAGGGSIARVDEMNRLRVGPASAGSEPGPACYGRGGSRATVTDANLVLGKLDPERFAGGQIGLERERAEDALDRDVGGRLGLAGHWPAVGVVEMVDENMANAARVHAIERGKVIGRHAMVAFGGGAPLHAGRLAQKLGIDRVVIPKGAGVGSAIGFLLAPIAYEVVRTLPVDFRDFDAGAINSMLDEMQAEAAAVVRGGAPPGAALAATRVVELRYVGQGHDLRIGLDDGPLTRDDGQVLKDRFEERYRAVYGLTIDGLDIQSVSWSVTVATQAARASRAEMPSGRPPAARADGHRSIYDASLEEAVRCPVYSRFALAPGAEIAGPAIIAEDETATFVPAGFSAALNSFEYIIMDNRGGEGRLTMTDRAPDAPIDAIYRQVMWDRLIAVVEEQAQTILRTAFGSVVREAGDLSGGVYDLRGRMIAQAVTGTPGHVNTMARAVEHFLVRFPVESMKPGDVFVTNDPWLGTGHLFDFVVVSPACLGGKPVALLASTCHVIDVGGRGFSAEAKSIYEEGVLIPHMRLREGGALNEDLMTILLANTRNPVEVRGDILSLVSCNDTGAERLRDMMSEFDLVDIEPLADHVVERSREAMRKAVRAVPNGRYRTEMELDGYDEPVFIKALMTVSDEEIVIDYAGTSRASAYGINSPLCYTEAYTCFGLKCIVAPEVPNNHGSLSVFRTVAEPGSAVHPVHPSPVTARHVIGQMLPDVAFGCLAQALPGRIPAESAGSIWVLPFANAGADAGGGASGGNASRFNVMNVGMGGIGARPGKDGLSVTAFPSGVGAIPVEVTEAESPLVFWRKEFLPDSGGAGAVRGGLGQVIEVGNTQEHPFTVSAATFDRMRNPPRGRDGGRPGRNGTARLASGPWFTDKAVHTVPAGDRLIVELPGGGGLGEPRKRSPDLVRADLEAGYVSREGAKRDYDYE